MSFRFRKSQENTTSQDNLIFFALSILFLVYLSVHNYLSIYTRYLTDDYCIGGMAKEYGFWGAQVFERNIISGRYSSFFLLHLAELAGIKGVVFLPIIVFFLFIFSVIFFFSYIFISENTSHLTVWD